MRGVPTVESIKDRLGSIIEKLGKDFEGHNALGAIGEHLNGVEERINYMVDKKMLKVHKEAEVKAKKEAEEKRVKDQAEQAKADAKELEAATETENKSPVKKSKGKK